MVKSLLEEIATNTVNAQAVTLIKQFNLVHGLFNPSIVMVLSVRVTWLCTVGYYAEGAFMRACFLSTGGNFSTEVP